ncbi:hypothetical protein F1D05_08490 [Kribbella qitaiheensis]|uniref:Uncharacterized protein n=1 Tax=Kribbella qitaiheensis TaxID=1544730 RepID=A0A7G6WVA4_9ACTN|nr:hypothetical protein [Kribbella qitaiheensis]QNE17919.1 hypothetical protein F1D05_08490 [Kribbella qitaiheensis]
MSRTGISWPSTSSTPYRVQLPSDQAPWTGGWSFPVLLFTQWTVQSFSAGLKSRSDSPYDALVGNRASSMLTAPS